MLVKKWTDPKTMLPCMICDCHGHLCGYVGVSPQHPLYGRGYGEHVPALAAALERVKEEPIGDRGALAIFCTADDPGSARMDIVFDVHGSVTFAGHFERDCSDPWWIGFDCAHLDDTPAFWDVPRTTAETERLAAQIAEVQS